MTIMQEAVGFDHVYAVSLSLVLFTS